MMSSHTILEGDALTVLKTLPSQSVHTCVTSPPYYGVRDYHVDGQLGLEPSHREYIRRMVAVFSEVRRVLRDDGTCWINMGDVYYNYRPGLQDDARAQGFNRLKGGSPRDIPSTSSKRNRRQDGFKEKDLMGIPWRLALALHAHGWHLRSDIIWSKPNPMPESVEDRPVKSHEYIFLLTKRQDYYYDYYAVLEPANGNAHSRGNGLHRKLDEVSEEDYEMVRSKRSWAESTTAPSDERNRRTVWTVATEGHREAHFATYPTALIAPCILAGTSAKGACPQCGAQWIRVVEKTGGTTGESWHDHEDRLGLGQRKPQEKTPYKREHRGWTAGCKCGSEEVAPPVVLDPFCGFGTTLLMARRLGRNGLGIELKGEYVRIAERRIEGDQRANTMMLPFMEEVG